MRLFWLVGSLALALLIGVLSLQVPAPAGADAPATAFSAERAMADVRERQRPDQPEQPHETSSPMTRRP